MAGKPDLAATSGVQNVVVYVSNDNFAQAYTVGQQNVPSNAHLLHNPGYGNAPPSMSPVVSATKTFPEKQSIKPEYSSNDSSSVPSQGYFTNVISQNSFPQPLVNDISYQNGAVIKNYGNGEVLSVERQAGPGRTEAKVREECDNRDMYVEPGYMTVMGAEMPSQSVRCDSVRSEAAESSCSSLSSADESLLVVQNQQSEMVVYDGNVNVRPAGVVLAVGPPPLQQQAQNNTSTVGTLNSVQKPYVTVPHGWKRLNNGSVVYISPSNTALSSPEEVKEYLLTAGTCKCGLECPFKYDNVFNFDPKVAGKPWILMPDTNPGDLTKLCNHKRKIMGLVSADCKPPDHVNKLQRREYIKRSKRKIGLPYAGGIPISQIPSQREKVALNQHSFNKDPAGNPQQVFPQTPVNNQQIISNRFPNYQEPQQNHHLVRYQDGTVMVQQANNPANISSQQMTQNHHVPQNGSSINIQSHQIIGPNGQIINVQGTLGSSNQNQQVSQLAQSQNMVQPQELHQHRIFINGQPNEPTGPGRPNVQMVPVSIPNQQNINQQRQEMQQRSQHQQQQQQQQMQFYNNHLAFQHGHPYDPSKNVRPFGQMMQHAFRPHSVTNHPNQLTHAPVQIQNQQQRMQWHNNRLQQTITQQQQQQQQHQHQQQLQQQQLQQQQLQQQQQSNQSSICERVPPLHQHTPPPVVWQEEIKRKKVKLGKVNKNRPYHMMEGCPTNHAPCPNIDVRQIPAESRAVIINHFPQNNQNSASPSFMEDPSGYLAQQTALLNSTINRQTGANGCTGYVCNSPVTSVQNPQQHIITVSNSQGNEVPLPSNIAASQMKTQPMNMPAKPIQNVNFVRNQQPTPNVGQQQYSQVQVQPNLADSSALPDQHQYSMHCHCCVADNTQQNQYQNQKISSRASSTSGTPSSSGTLEDPVTSSTYSEKQFNQTSPDSRPIQGGTVSTSNVSPTDGNSSNPPTPNPHTSNPHTPNPHTPNPHTPNSHTPNPHTPNPHTPNSHTPNPHTPNPQTPNHHVPNPHTPSPHIAKPPNPNLHIANPSNPNPHSINLHTSNAPNLHNPNPHAMNSHNPHSSIPPQRILDSSQIINNGVPFVTYSQQSQMHHMDHVGQSRETSYPKLETVCCSYAHPSRMAGLVTTMASGRTVGSNTITSVLAGRANTATVSINSPSSVAGSSPPNSFANPSSIQTQAITVNVSKSPLEMVQSVVSSIVPHSQQVHQGQTGSQMSPQIIKHSPTGLSPGHIFVSSGGQLIMASTGNGQGGMMAPPPPKLIASQSGMPPISVSPMVTNVTGSMAQVIPAVAQQVLGQQTVLVNALPAPFVLQPGVTMTMDGMQNMQLPQLMASNVIQQQIQIDNSDARRLPALLSPETKKKVKKKKGSPQTVASMLHIAAQQNSGVVMSQQGFPQQIQMSHSPQGITTGPVMQALTIVPSKTGGPPQIVMNGQAMANTNLGTQQLITNSQPAQQINLLQPVNLINGTTGVVQNFPAIQQFIVPNLGGMVMNPDGTATILQDASNLGMQLQIQNVNGQNVLTPVQNNAMFNGGQSILAAGPAGMVIRTPTSQGKIIQQQQHSPGAQFLSPNGGQFVVNGTQFSGQLSPLVASVSPNQQVTFSTSPQQIRTSNSNMQPQQEYIQMNGQMGQTLMVPCTPATNIAVSSSNQQNTTFVQQNTTIVQQQTTMVANNQQLQNFQQQNTQQNQQNMARTATLNLDQQNYIVSSNDNKQMQAVIVQQRDNPQAAVNYKQSVSTQTAVNQNAQSVTTNTFCQTSTISAGSPPDTTTLSPLPLAPGGQSPPTADTTTHTGSTDDGLSPAPSNCSASCSDVNVQSRPQSCTMAMVHCISSSEPDSADLNQSTEIEWRRNQQGGATPKQHYGDLTHFGKRSTPTHVAFAESSTLVSGLQYVSEHMKPQDAVISSRNYERMMHKRKASESLGHVLLEAHHRQTALFEDDEEEKNNIQTKRFTLGELVWGPAKGCSAWPGKIIKLHDASVSVKWFGSEKFVSEIDCHSLQTLSEGLDAHHQARKKLRTSRKLNNQLEKAIQEAMSELDNDTEDVSKKRTTESKNLKISKMPVLQTSSRKMSGRVKSSFH
nr:nuclear receptor coactivator 6-like isoform X1 [Leptinotarsa decemlineata]